MHTEAAMDESGGNVKARVFSADATPFGPDGSGESWNFQSGFSVSSQNYRGTPLVRKKKESEGDGGLSALAKPWTPTATQKFITAEEPSWTTSLFADKEAVAPAPLFTDKESGNLFVHSFEVVLASRPSVTLEVYNYVCGRCPIKTLFGRLSSRKADISLANIALDVPPLCIAHLVEQIVKVKVTALNVHETEYGIYDLWLDKPNMATQVQSKISGRLWTCPMFHGTAILGHTEEGKEFLTSYLKSLSESEEGKNCPFSLKMVEKKVADRHSDKEKGKSKENAALKNNDDEFDVKFPGAEDMVWDDDKDQDSSLSTPANENDNLSNA